MSRPLNGGVPKLADALAMARDLGLTVRALRRHGEWAVSAPNKRPLKISARRKDASAMLLVYLRQAERATAKRS
jgi:hypothetical protein